MNLTYKQLIEKLKTLNEEQLNQNVTVSLDISSQSEPEAVPVKDLVIIQDGDFLDGVLDVGHAVLSVDF